MSELYRASDNSSDQAAETEPTVRADHQPTRDNAARQNQDDAAIEARLDEADLPTRAEARAAALRPDTDDEDDDYDEDNFGPEFDAAIEARLDEAGLPTRAEARAAALRPDADDEDDEDDFSPESEEAIEARLDEADLPTQAESRAAASRPDAIDENDDHDHDDYDDDQAAEYNGVLGALTVEDHPLDTGTSDRDQAAASDALQVAGSVDDQRAGSRDSNTEASAEMAERADAEITELLTELEVVLGKERVGDHRAHYERLVRGDQQSPDALPAGTPDGSSAVCADNAEPAAIDTSDRIAEVEAREARHSKEIADLRTQPERLEQRNQERSDAPIPPGARDVKELSGQRTKPEHRWLSSDARAVLSITTAGYALGHMADYVAPVVGDVLKNIGDVLPLVALAIPVWRENRKEKNVHRSED